MTANEHIPDRHQFRADWHDYNRGVYFVTICCHDKQHFFGKITNGMMRHSSIGTIVERCIKTLSDHTPYASVWNHVIMPNHIHMVIAVGAQYIAPATASHNIGCLKNPKHEKPCDDFHHNSLLAVAVRTFKAAVTRTVRAQCIAPLQSQIPQHIWQRSFHDHIIRNQHAYDLIMNYIDTNIENWCYDLHNPDQIDPAAAPWRKVPSAKPNP